jgi:hypothetical protein
MPQESPQTDPAPESSGNAAVGWLRFLVWLMPTALVPGLILLMSGAFVLLRKLGVTGNFQDAKGFVILFWMIGSMVGTLGLGYFDARMKRQQEKISRENDRPHDGLHVLKFFLLQLALVPSLMLVVFVVMEMVAPAVRP